MDIPKGLLLGWTIVQKVSVVSQTCSKCFNHLCLSFCIQKQWGPRFCKEVCSIQPKTVDIPLVITDDQGDDFETMKDIAVIWPWDFFAYLWNSGKFLQWVSDDPTEAGFRTTQFWEHCEGLEFFNQLGLDASQYASCVPVSFHADGVKIYKNQKAWIYSLSSSCRKGPSMSTKLVYIMVRDNQVIKGKTHDSIGKLTGYIMDILSTGKFPHYDFDGSEFPAGSPESRRAGATFAGGWTFGFSAFRGDWEARVIIHKLTRYYRTTYICEHCMASYKNDFSFADFKTTAASQLVRLSHSDFLALNPVHDQSSWTSVRGWTKDRNLEEPCIYSINLLSFSLRCIVYLSLVIVLHSYPRHSGPTSCISPRSSLLCDTSTGLQLH